MKKIVSALVLFLLLSGCSQIRNLGFKSYSNSFTNNLKTNTSSITLYRDFTTIATVKATHFNKQLMKQYIEYTQGINLAKNRDKKYLNLVDAFDRYDIFWVAFYTDDDDINNLASKDSFWNIYLVEGDKTISPIAIREVGSNNFKKQWLYLVKSNRWSREYIIKFKKTKYAKGKVTLVISSFLGTVYLNFKH